MVSMHPLVAVLCLAVAVQAGFKEFPGDVKDIITNQKGKQYELYKKNTEALKLPNGALDDAFTGLNINGKGDVDKDDLELFYWFSDLKYAIPKFLNMMENEEKNGVLTKAEMKDDFEKKEIKVALIECTYLKSPGLRQSCYADQLLTYAALVMDQEDVNNLFKSLDKDGNGVIKVDELNAKFALPQNKDKEITAEELGAYYGPDGVTKEEFKDYLIQESILDDFRACRKPEVDTKTGNIDFKEDCIFKEVVKYANDDLTELDISVLFRAVAGDDLKITKTEIKTLLQADDEHSQAVMNLLDMSITTGSEAIIDYGEFRTYLRSPTVVVQLEKKCTEKKDTQIEEIECLYNNFLKLIDELHKPIWLVVPDLDQTISFEILDSTDNGEITEEELKFENPDAKKRFMAEINTDKSDPVTLEEFNEYMDIPHMVYGTADCLLKSRKTPADRAKCFPTEIEDIIDNFKFIEDVAWESWFKFYNTKVDDKIDELDSLKGDDKLGSSATLFLEELGQGGKSVSLFEFKWYVKQQELAEQYEKVLNIKASTNKLEDAQITSLNKVLKDWIENYMTEYDIEMFFDKLDTHDDDELTKADFDAAVWEKVEKLILKIDEIEPESDADKTVNFREFWLWLHSPKPKDAKKKLKNIFETECTQKKDTQSAEIECYVGLFKNPTNFI